MSCKISKVYDTLKFVCQKKIKKVFLKRENIGVSFLAATIMATTFARIAILFSRFMIKQTIYFVLLFGGFKEGVLPGGFVTVFWGCFFLLFVF
ncbi:hypothetical protein FLBR109950_08455 [Flavobacterium branchiophilum]|uniref:Uncharacterized protein n=1 Tax=Flavobacterium branchiophilum (strain FL-15) TaxID=1034807 RepID=G2Z2X5_FLABF|nr:Hypothetical protein FBFL15_2284 [Flavobacterium branchiophilum FL-15]